ncbi:F-box domain protein [Fonsecaea pedrosoi]|nr:F-box domain protein [Fonsecaea pedrosoi]
MEATVELEEAPAKPLAKGAETLLAKHLHGRKQEWDAITAHKEPLRLLDLPVDILQTILRELTHTNDLTSLALTHSALHALVIPHIYARFDIVWPDANATFENRMGVDALTYGLATLVMAQDVFGEAPYQQQIQHQCQNCGHHNRAAQTALERPKKIRRGNHFAQYTRKFSLGNGPAEWVQEYLITKEGGKMLGTLVALAVGRMRNLEAFIWDMPTGVLRDVWMALASLGNRDDGRECRLERVWVRWHDNQDQGPLASPPPPGSIPGPQASNLPAILAGSADSLFQIPPYPRVEFPTFSILPPLKSLSVLDIDELPYAEEMSVLIERSLGRLQELRVGIASHAQFDIWARPSEDRTSILPPLMPGIGDQTPRPGGILGILVHRFCDTFSHYAQNPKPSSIDPQQGPAQNAAIADTSRDPEREEDHEGVVSTSEVIELGALLSAQSIQGDHSEAVSASATKQRSFGDAASVPNATQTHNTNDTFQDFPREGRPVRKLQLETLELERVYLSIAVLSKAIDWSRLTTLTLLGCRNHDQLWKALRKRFTPTNRRRVSTTPFRISANGMSSMLLRSQTGTPPPPAPASSDYPLRLRRLHTDMVSPALIAFIKDTLAPDSLEWLFLQENTAYKSPVSIDMIYKSAIRRHRSSLTKLLIDSTLRTEDPDRPNTNWRRWVCNRELITCITSGKMKLRELSMSIDYKDWHYFLRRLPNATTLRSLHIPHIAEHVNGTVHSREAALQVLDIVALRPELELCYLGIQSQCFEILEYASPRKGSSSGMSSLGHPGDDMGPDGDMMATHGNAAPTPHDHDSHDEEAGENGEGGAANDDSDFDAISDDGNGLTDDEDGSDDGGEGGGPGGAKPTWRLREILFYDDKISIFKARHGRL